jgi:hypothetical protein
MNCIAWTVGHLAFQEQGFWLFRAQQKVLFSDLYPVFGTGAPMSTPALPDTLRIWKEVVLATEPYLDSVTTASLKEQLLLEGKSIGQSVGSALRRMTYHYWYHLGEVQAIRQMLGHSSLPEYVGPIESEAPYVPET